MLAYSMRSTGLVVGVVARQPVCARTIATLRLCQRSSRFPSFVLGRRSSSHSKRMSSTSKDASPGWIAWYSSKLDTHPLLVKGISSGLIAGAGDFLCQFFIEQHSYDIVRTVRFTILGTFVVTPFVHTWFGFLNKTFPGVSAVAISKRVVIDQLAFSPCFLSIWLSCLWTMEGERDTGIIATRIVDSMPSIMVANWGLWIPAQVINFRFVPIKFQVLYSNVVALLWNVYLSYTQTRKQFHVE